MKRLSMLLIFLLQALTGIWATGSMDWSKSIVFPEWTYRSSETSCALGQCPAGPFTRTYTGHEELWQFGLLNANARLYNPYIGRFISPDPLLNSEGGPLDFNPYVYARNNPYSYIDRNGEIPFWVVFGIVMGGSMNVWINFDNIDGVWDFCKFFGVGAAAGALTSVGVGALGIGGAGFFTGFANGAITGAASNLIQAGMNYAFLGVPYSFDWKEFLMQTAISGGIGGIAGGIQARMDGKNFWTGKPISSSLSAQTPSDLSPSKVAVFDESEPVSVESSGKGVTKVNPEVYIDNNDPYYQKLLKEAQERYPKKEGHIEKHHIYPKYIYGQENNNLTVPIDAAYHQMITNEFRKYIPYGKKEIDLWRKDRILHNVYKKYPLPQIK